MIFFKKILLTLAYHANYGWKGAWNRACAVVSHGEQKQLGTGSKA